MKFTDCKCPVCHNRGFDLQASAWEDDGLYIDRLYFVCSKCSDPPYHRDIIQRDSTIIEWIINISKHIPEEGKIVEVDFDDEQEIPLSFTDNSKHYEITETIFSWSIPKSILAEQRYWNTFYYVKLEGGNALLLKTPKAWLWLDFEMDLSPDVHKPLRVFQLDEITQKTSYRKNKRTCEKAYSIFYDIEKRLRTAIEEKFRDNLESELNINFGKGDKQVNLLKKLREKRDQEQAEWIDAPVDGFSILDYAEFWDLIQIIQQKWKLFFPSKGDEARKSLGQDLEKIRWIRNSVAHMRNISDDDIELLKISERKLARYFPTRPYENARAAIADYDRFIADEPKDAIAYFARGVAKAEFGNLKDTIGDFDKAIELDPKFALAYGARGVGKDMLGDYKGAIADYDKAIELDPKYPFAYHNRGNAKANLGEYKSAIADYNKAIELDPKYAMAYSNRGLVKDILSNHKNAIADFDKAIEINPKFAMAYNNRGLAKDGLGDYEGAIKDFDKAIELDHECALAYLSRGLVKNMLGDPKGAIADFDKAIEIEPKFAEAYYHLARLYALKKDKDKMLKNLKKAIELDNEHKEMAKKDKDFKNYWEDEDFKELVE